MKFKKNEENIQKFKSTFEMVPKRKKRRKSPTYEWIGLFHCFDHFGSNSKVDFQLMNVSCSFTVFFLVSALFGNKVKSKFQLLNLFSCFSIFSFEF